MTKNLEKWAKDEKAPDVDLAYSLMKPTIRKDPLGCVLVIGYVTLLSFSLSLADLSVLRRPVAECVSDFVRSARSMFRSNSLLDPLSEPLREEIRWLSSRARRPPTAQS